MVIFRPLLFVSLTGVFTKIRLSSKYSFAREKHEGLLFLWDFDKI
jgi:hypothetical protein